MLTVESLKCLCPEHSSPWMCRMTRTVPPARSLPEDINAFLLILRRGSNDVTIIHKVSSDGEFIRIDV